MQWSHKCNYRTNAKFLVIVTSVANTKEEVTFALNNDTVETFEDNTTVDYNTTSISINVYYNGSKNDLTFSDSVWMSDVNKTAATHASDIGVGTANVFTSNANMFDTNSTDLGKIVTTMEYRLTDEFGKTSDMDVNVTINRAPHALTSTEFNFDMNTTGIVAGNAATYDTNSTTATKISDYNYENNNIYEFTAGLNILSAINAGGLTNRSADANVTLTIGAGVVNMDINDSNWTAVAKLSIPAAGTTELDDVELNVLSSAVVGATGYVSTMGLDINFTISYIF